MFENNLVRDEINKNRKLKAEEEENKILNEDNDYYVDTNERNQNYYRKKRKKFKKSRSEINLNRYDIYKRQQFDPLAFQQKTAMNAREILNNIKKNLGTYLVEEELKKNEQYQSLNEGINELKADLNNKLDRIQQSQKKQMQKIYYCLLNSGDKNVENAAFKLLNDYSERNNELFKKLDEPSSKKSTFRNGFRTRSKLNTESRINNEEDEV